MDALKALALIAIVLNHLVESFGPGPWFTNPDWGWADLGTRLKMVFPADPNPVIALVRFAGWLGDSGPGVFILLSGFGLTWTALRKNAPRLSPSEFYRRRLLRLFPLYIATHFVILTASLLVPGDEATLASPRALLSLLGLRFTSGLFFWLSPAWWFVWLILQLYLIYPLLYALLRSTKVTFFLAVTFAITLLSRGFGLLHWAPVSSLYFWMTGIFAGTRLAEFAVGMALAATLVRHRELQTPLPSTGRILAVALPTYILGFVSSLFWIGTLVSNLLVTVGLTALLYVGWLGLARFVPSLRESVLWLGRESYGVYLIHHPPLLWAAALLGDRPKFQLLAALTLTAAGLPAAWLLRNLVERIQRSLSAPHRNSRWQLANRAAPFLIALLLAFDTGPASSVTSRVLAIAIGLGALLVVQEEARHSCPGIARSLRTASLFGALLLLFILPGGLGPSALLLGTGFAVIEWTACAAIGDRWRVRLGAMAFTGLLLLVSEVALARWAPLEAGRWGEFPAIEIHATRVYGLRPNALTHLRYNNYDYTVRTNGYGLPGPAVSPERHTPDTLRALVVGDAFSMPEGLDYRHSYPALLESRLRDCLAPRPVQVINAGVTGYGPVEELAQLKELAPIFRPDVVIWQFFINEFTEAVLTPEERRLNIGFPVGSRAAGLRGRLQLAAWGHWLQDRTWELITRRPGKWRREKALLEYYAAGPNPIYSPTNLEAVRRALGEMQAAAASGGGKLIVYFVPGAVAVSKPSDIHYLPWTEDLANPRFYDLSKPFQTLMALAAPFGIPVVDLTSDLRSHQPQPVYFPDSWHWNREGHRAVAAAMAHTLAESGVNDLQCNTQ